MIRFDLSALAGKNILFAFSVDCRSLRCLRYFSFNADLWGLRYQKEARENKKGTKAFSNEAEFIYPFSSSLFRFPSSRWLLSIPCFSFPSFIGFFFLTERADLFNADWTGDGKFPESIRFQTWRNLLDSFPMRIYTRAVRGKRGRGYFHKGGGKKWKIEIKYLSLILIFRGKAVLGRVCGKCIGSGGSRWEESLGGHGGGEVFVPPEPAPSFAEISFRHRIRNIIHFP